MTTASRIMLIALTALFTLAPFQPAAFAEEVNSVSGEMTFDITVDAPADAKVAKLWVPYPGDNVYQDISKVRVNGNYSYQGVYREKNTGNMMLYAEWSEPVKEQRKLTLTFNATSHLRAEKGAKQKENNIPSDIQPFLASSEHIPTTGKVKEAADKATKGKYSVGDKARAVYDWVVDNTYRDPNVVGCGLGEADRMLTQKGGKCADISSVYVAVARAAGVPAREVFGIRIGKDDGVSDMTKGHHCWAEYYLPGAGWIPADPADVRKAILEKKLDDKGAAEYREKFFQGLDPYRIALATGGRDYYLNPKQEGGPLNYFMYPYGEVDGKPMEWLAAQKDLKFKVTFKKDSAKAGIDNPVQVAGASVKQ
ncbi:MAG: transglutaminase domain-containing protein [Nitrospinae bacterium]|nr:transglutaminase domain-containing protein [Nitrospinota bacterium]MBF0634525.1 transglutaminase domain-containing protein [Nitrospinota bacterium]